MLIAFIQNDPNKCDFSGVSDQPGTADTLKLRASSDRKLQHLK